MPVSLNGDAVIILNGQEFPVYNLTLDRASKPTVLFKYRSTPVTATVHTRLEKMNKQQRRALRIVLGLPPRQPHTKRRRKHGGRLSKLNQRRRT